MRLFVMTLYWKYMVFSMTLSRTVRITGMFVLFILISSCFVWLARTVQQGQLLWFDEPIMRWLHMHSSAVATVTFLVLTQTGGGIGVALLTAGITGWLVYRREVASAWFVGLSVAGAGLLNVWLKLLFERTRPDFWQHLVHETSYSFPSGHAMGSSALAFVVVGLLWSTRWRWFAVAMGGIYIIIIGISRMYLGVHYPSDILAGWLVSFVWTLLVYRALYEYTRRKQRS